MKHNIGSIQRVLGILILTGFSYSLGAQSSEGGGTTGADFLLYPPASRTDAMGGALDPYGDNLEAVLLNPALLTTVDSFKVQININPLPNEVTNSMLSVGLPLGGGVGGIAAQLFNVGEFTNVNEVGQSLSTVSVYDAAVAVGYAYPILSSISAGATLKAVYRVLSENTAIAFGGDIGASWIFETPHIGQRPKMATFEQLEAAFERRRAVIIREHDRLRTAAAKIPDSLRKEIEDLEAELQKLQDQLESAVESVNAAEEAEDRAKAEEKQEEVENAIAGTSDERGAKVYELEQALVEERMVLKNIDAAQSAAIAVEQKIFDEQVTELDFIQQERKRLFSVVNDPVSELVESIIDTNINESIRKTQEFLRSRIASFQEAERSFNLKREARRESLEEVLATYQKQVDNELGPAFTRLTEESGALNLQIEELRESITEENEEEVNGRIKELEDQVKDKTEEIGSLEADPWIRRLRNRIADKQKEIESVTAEIEQNKIQTDNNIEDVEIQSAADIENFESLRTSLVKELKRAKLKRELDLVDAAAETDADTAIQRYEETETRIYQELIAAMYSNEEKIFQAQLNSIRLDSEERKFDFDGEQQRSRETLEEDFAFRERFLVQKIADLQRVARESESESEDPELLETEAELADQREVLATALDELNRIRSEFLANENARVNSESDEVRAKREQIRLIFLQTDEPFQNTSLTLATRSYPPAVSLARSQKSCASSPLLALVVDMEG